MKMLGQKSELTPKETIWAWLELYLMPKDAKSKKNRLDYQLLFKNGAYASRLDSRDQ